MPTFNISFISSAVEIALTVFVILTAFLAAFVIAIFASKRFREMLFSNDRKQPERKSPKKRAAPKKPKAQPQQNYLAYNDSVPTVPLMGGMTASDDVDVMRCTNDALVKITLGSRAKTAQKTTEPPTVAITAPPAAKPAARVAERRTTANTTEPPAAKAKTAAKTETAPQRRTVAKAETPASATTKTARVNKK